MAYQSNLTHIVEPWISDAFGWAEDHIRPMTDDKLIGISLRFWQPSDTDRGELFEGLWSSPLKRRTQSPTYNNG